jgi:peptidoglycan/LPS O-acetylase OafA/YrhL
MQGKFVSECGATLPTSTFAENSTPASPPASAPAAHNSPDCTRRQTSGRLPSLDGLRAVSIAMVLIAHVPDTFSARPFGTSTLLTIFGNGALGVSIFFAISGFLITTLLLNEFRETGDISLRAFYLRRAFRILPAFYTYLAVIGGLSLAGAIVTKRADFLSSAFFVWNYYWPARNWFLGHTWS